MTPTTRMVREKQSAGREMLCAHRAALLAKRFDAGEGGAIILNGAAVGHAETS